MAIMQENDDNLEIMEKYSSIILFKDRGYFVLPCPKFIIPSKIVLKISMVSHIFKWEPQMEIENI